MTLGERFRFVRESAGHTHESLAAESGISRATIVKVENDASSPTVHTLAALLKACGSNLGAFFNIDEAGSALEDLVSWNTMAALEGSTVTGRFCSL